MFGSPKFSAAMMLRAERRCDIPPNGPLSAKLTVLVRQPAAGAREAVLVMALQAVQAMQRLEELRWKLERYAPKNGYEEDLLHLDVPALAVLESRLLGASSRPAD